jgi:Zn-dependent peptidase ImmA (M78 family)
MAGLLAQLRAIVPLRPLTLPEGLGLAEIQAETLLVASNVTSPPVPESVVIDFPRVRVIRERPLPISGASHWTAGVWTIIVNEDEPQVRQRFTMAHELKHVLDAAHTPAVLYPTVGEMDTDERAERVCDFFAASLLMPRKWVKRAFSKERVQQLPTLARRFHVSQVAMRRRLYALGLADPHQRHLPPTPPSPQART